MSGKGLKDVSEAKFRAFLGLEMAMPILQMNNAPHCWRKEMLAGHHDFKQTMSRNDFQQIRTNLALRDPSSYSHEEASSDPLRHSRKLLEHFQKNECQVAAPLGASALDEASVRAKARATASSFIASKPGKFAVRFCAVASSKRACISSMLDSRSGNSSGESAPQACCRIRRELRTPHNKALGDSNLVEKDSPTALWILQMAHLTKLLPDPSGKRAFFTDNFRARRALAKELKKMTGNEARLCGAVRFENVGAANRGRLAEAISIMKDAAEKLETSSRLR